MAKIFNILMLLLIAAIILGGCSGPVPSHAESSVSATTTPKENTTNDPFVVFIPIERDSVVWMEINSPPGVQTKCWAFFFMERLRSPRADFNGYTGVYCLPPEQ